MSKPIIKIVNVETGEELEREMTNAEYEDYLADQAQVEAMNNEIENQASAKAALLEKLGITEDEAKLLLK